MSSPPLPPPVPFAVPDLDRDDIAAVVRVLESGWLTTGAECLGLEADLAAYLGIDHVVAMSSCTAALDTAVAYLDLPAGSRIGVPAWTFVSSALCAVRLGHQPVLLDVDPDTLNLSADALGTALEGGTDGAGLAAVVGVHFGGVALDRSIHDQCASAGIPLIEDAAHALGSRDHRGLVAGQGSAGACFSFYATKNLTSAEGGALATDDPDLADFARSYRLHGLSRDAWARYTPGVHGAYDLVMPGIKANLPDVLAALARSQFRRFDAMQAARRAIVARYREQLADVAGLRFVPATLDPASADHLAAVLLPEGTDRRAVADALDAAGISTSVHFRPLHTFDWFAEHGAIGPGGLPVADALAARQLSLPLYPGLSLRDVDRIATELGAALAGAAAPRS
jgi:dTDP-4-amino-4,6-dideoxygalactose transaminase